jgi:PleD family two-component response regulator
VARSPLGSWDFIKFGDRKWTTDELNALEAIGSQFAQLQARIYAEEQLVYLAEHDDLTGMHNRRALLAHLEDRLQPGRSGPVALLFLDLDRLKAINDLLGHTAGDQFIGAVAQRLDEKVGDSSLIARLGGDEFVVVPAGEMAMKKPNRWHMSFIPYWAAAWTSAASR